MKLVNWLVENHRMESFLLKIGHGYEKVAAYIEEKIFTKKFIGRLLMTLVTILTARILTGFYHPVLSGCVLLLFAGTLFAFLFSEDGGNDEG